jgi:hypothetical protein
LECQGRLRGGGLAAVVLFTLSEVALDEGLVLNVDGIDVLENPDYRVSVDKKTSELKYSATAPETKESESTRQT